MMVARSYDLPVFVCVFLDVRRTKTIYTLTEV